jgi:hypothetical protein
MPRMNLWSHSMPRAEIDQRSREARLRFELVVRLFMLRDPATRFGLRRRLYSITVGRYGRLSQEGGVKDPPSSRWPPGIPMLLGLWLENSELCNCSGLFNF